MLSFTSPFPLPSFFVDEGSAFDALKTLADLSLMLPVTNPDTGKAFEFIYKILMLEYYLNVFFSHLP